MRIARRLVVSGRVQGVGYRAFVEREAMRLGLNGWVRNRRDGTVEAVVAGEEKAIEVLVAACRQGPVHASVSDTTVKEWLGEPAVPGSGFSILPTF